jgi:uncharacterized membrane protein YkoI
MFHDPQEPLFEERAMKWILTLLAALSISLVSPYVAGALGGDKDEKEGTEEKVTLDQCPAAVQDTIKKEAAGGTIQEIEKETKGGVTIYEAEIVKDGKTVEIEVAADGKLLKSKVKAGKDDDDQKGKDKGKE